MSSDQLSLFLRLLGRALTLDPAAFAEIEQLQGANWFALSILLLAGVSEALGHSIVLFLNRVPPRRFIASLVLSGLLFVLGYLFWIGSVHLIAGMIYGRQQALNQVAQAVAFGYAPLLFGFIILAPGIGSFLGQLLSAWSLLAIIVALTVTLNLHVVEALICSGLGWLALQLLRRTIGRPLDALERNLRQFVAGVPLELDLTDLTQPGELEPPPVVPGEKQ